MKAPEKEIKRQPKNWEKGFVNYTSYEGLTSRIYKEFSKPNSKKKKIATRK